MMKFSPILLSGLFLSAPVFAQQGQSNTYSTQNCYMHYEHYTAGSYNSDGSYRKGNLKTKRKRVPCNQVEVAHGAYHGGYHQPYPQTYAQPYPQPYPQQQSPIVIQQGSSQSSGCDRIARMGLGAGGGALAGRYIGGGSKSKHTIRNTTIGAIAGGVIGRMFC